MFLAVVSGVVSFTAGPVRAATTERIVADPHTGLAISGFDPVAYFTNAAAVPGRPEFELRLKGVLIPSLDRGPESVDYWPQAVDRIGEYLFSSIRPYSVTFAFGISSALARLPTTTCPDDPDETAPRQRRSTSAS